MAFEVEVPVRHRTMWLAFTDPEKMARAVPGLTVDAVHPVPPADGPEGVAGDVVAGRLKLRVGPGTAGSTITYRGTACIAGAEAHKGTLDIAVDAAQARGNGALAGYLRVTLNQAGTAGDRTLITVVPELELSGRALEFSPEDWHGAVEALAAAWIDALAADYRDADDIAVAAPEGPEVGVVPEVAVVPDVPVVPIVSDDSVDEPSAVEEVAVKAPSESESKSAEPDSLSDDPLAAVWSGRYEKNRWLPVIIALTLFLLIKRRRRHRADKQGADSSFRME
jgi:carbon monoxide dehydrogenase subunit G